MRRRHLHPTPEGRVLRGSTRFERIRSTVDRHRRHLHHGLLREAIFQRLQRGVPGLQTEYVAIAMNHDFHEVGIVEGTRGLGERRLVEWPTR